MESILIAFFFKGHIDGLFLKYKCFSNVDLQTQVLCAEELK